MKKAEERVLTEPVSTAGYCRLVLEEVMHNIYDQLRFKPFGKKLILSASNQELLSCVKEVQKIISEQLKSCNDSDKDKQVLIFLVYCCYLSVCEFVLQNAFKEIYIF